MSRMSEVDCIIDGIFAQFDKDGSGKLEREECNAFFEELFASLGNIDSETKDEIVNAVDANGDSELTKGELRNLLVELGF